MSADEVQQKRLISPLVQHAAVFAILLLSVRVVSTPLQVIAAPPYLFVYGQAPRCGFYSLLFYAAGLLAYAILTDRQCNAQ